MSDTPTIPPLILTYVHDYSQKVLTALSVWAMTHGANQFVDALSTSLGTDHTTLTSAVIQIGVGAAAFAASCAWTLGAGYIRHEKLKLIGKLNSP